MTISSYITDIRVLRHVPRDAQVHPHGKLGTHEWDVDWAGRRFNGQAHGCWTKASYLLEHILLQPLAVLVTWPWQWHTQSDCQQSAHRNLAPMGCQAILGKVWAQEVHRDCDLQDAPTDHETRRWEYIIIYHLISFHIIWSHFISSYIWLYLTNLAHSIAHACHTALGWATYFVDY